MLTRPLGLGRFLALVLLTIAACTALAVALPHDPYIRYQSFKGTIYERVAWIYERIHFDQTPIDVVVLGSSRSGAAVYPTLLEPALKERGLEARVVNFALPATGFDIRETLTEELLETRKVKLLIFDVIETFPRDGHDAFGNLATVRQVLTAPALVNRNLPRNLFRLPIRQIGLAFANWAPEAQGYRTDFDPSAYAGSTIDPRSMLNFDEKLETLDTPEHAALLDRQSQLRYRLTTAPILPERLGWIEFGVSRSYVDRITALAEAKGTKVAFLFLPFYKGPTGPREEAWLAARGPVLKGNLLLGDPRNFVDSGHAAASPRVKAMVTDWLADQIAPILRD